MKLAGITITENINIGIIPSNIVFQFGVYISVIISDIPINTITAWKITEYNPPNPHYNQYPNYKNRYTNTPYFQKYDYNYNHNYYRKENIYNSPCHNYDYERRKRRIKN